MPQKAMRSHVVTYSALVSTESSEPSMNVYRLPTIIAEHKVIRREPKRNHQEPWIRSLLNSTGSQAKAPRLDRITSMVLRFSVLSSTRCTDNLIVDIMNGYRRFRRALDASLSGMVKDVNVLRRVSTLCCFEFASIASKKGVTFSVLGKITRNDASKS